MLVKFSPLYAALILTICCRVTPGNFRRREKPLYFTENESERSEVEFEVKIKGFERVPEISMRLPCNRQFYSPF